MKYLLLISMFLIGCNHNIKLSDSKQAVTQSGSTYSYVIIKIEYIEQLKELCLDANPASLFENEDLRNKATATCVLSNLNLFNIDAPKVTDFVGTYCDNPQDVEIQSICQTLGAYL